MRILALTLVVFMTVIWVNVSPVQSQEKGEVELKALAETEVEITNDEGLKEVQRVPASKVVPGDVVIYTIHYVNRGSESAENFIITNPVPEHMIYLTGSAEGENSEITFSVDGGSSYDIPENLTVTDETGEQAAADVADYTHIRWTLNEPLASGETGYVNFKARLH